MLSSLKQPVARYRDVVPRAVNIRREPPKWTTGQQREPRGSRNAEENETWQRIGSGYQNNARSPEKRAVPRAKSSLNFRVSTRERKLEVAKIIVASVAGRSRRGFKFLVCSRKYTSFAENSAVYRRGISNPEDPRIISPRFLFPIRTSVLRESFPESFRVRIIFRLFRLSREKRYNSYTVWKLLAGRNRRGNGRERRKPGSSRAVASCEGAACACSPGPDTNPRRRCNDPAVAVAPTCIIFASVVGVILKRRGDPRRRRARLDRRRAANFQVTLVVSRGEPSGRLPLAPGIQQEREERRFRISAGPGLSLMAHVAPETFRRPVHRRRDGLGSMNKCARSCPFY